MGNMGFIHKNGSRNFSVQIEEGKMEMAAK